ncbi:MAG: hypothetical protein ACREOO_03965 [bacterium]
MMDLLTGLGFSKTDYQLFWICPIFSLIGTLISVFASDMNLAKPNTSGKLVILWIYFEWAIRRLYMGAATGLIVALYYVDVSSDSPASLARIFLLSIIVGYSAPRFWSTLEKVSSSRIVPKFSDTFEPEAKNKT